MTTRTEEINEMMELLKILWLRFPNMRLGQLLQSYIFAEGNRGDETAIRLGRQEDWKTKNKLKVFVGEKGD